MSTRLIILRAGEGPAVHDLASPASLGSGPHDLLVPGLRPGAARVSPAPDGVVLESSTTLVVAGQAVLPGTRILLEPGQRAGIGPHELWCELPSAPEGTRALAAALLLGVPAPPCSPALLAVEGPDAGRRWAVRDGSRVGRSRTADVRLSDPLVSRRHLRLAIAGTVASVRDEGGKNGVRVNGRRLRGAVRVRPGDVLAVGATRLRYLQPEDEGPAAAAPAGRNPPAAAPAPPRRRQAPEPLTIGAVLAAALAAGAAALVLAA